jgi:hypothetical protein
MCKRIIKFCLTYKNVNLELVHYLLNINKIIKIERNFKINRKLKRVLQARHHKSIRLLIHKREKNKKYIKKFNKKKLKRLIFNH